MLRRIVDAKDNFNVGVERREVKIVEVGANAEMQLVVGCEGGMVAEQSSATTVGIGKPRADFVPPAAGWVVAELGELDGDIGRWPAHRGIQNVRRDSGHPISAA